MIDFNLNEFLLAISFALDYSEIDLMSRVTNHSRRVAYTAVKMAKEFKMSEEEIFDIAALAILHDCGAGGSDYLINKSDPKKHCIKGEEIVSSFPFFTSPENVILYHHEFNDGTGFFGIKGDEIPLMAKIISLANTVETNYNNLRKSPEEIKKLVNSFRGTKFCDEIIDAYINVQSKVDFWIDIKGIFIQDTLKKLIPDRRVKYTYKKLHSITKVISGIIDSKSKFTGTHSSGLAEKAFKMGINYSYSESQAYKLMIAADLHDIGKLAISNRIIDKPGKLTEEEFNTIKSHPYYTKKALEGITGFDEIAAWASQHHERINGTGYPFGLSGDEIDFNSRLMTCLDIYQALTEERPYRNPMSHDNVLKILRDMAETGGIDAQIVEDIDRVFKNELENSL